jgi:hypothetical protein
MQRRRDYLETIRPQVNNVGRQYIYLVLLYGGYTLGLGGVRLVLCAFRRISSHSSIPPDTQQSLTP